MILGSLLRNPMRAGTPAPYDNFWYATDPKSGFTYVTGGVGTETAMRHAAVYAAVKLLAEDVGKLPLHLYRRLPDGGKERASDHALYDVLKTTPNTWQTATEFRQLMQARIELRGNAYAYILPGPRGGVDHLEPIDPDAVQNVSRNRNGTVVYEIRQPEGAPKRFTQDEIFHLRGFSLNGLTGLSTLATQADTISVGLAARQLQASAFRNGVRLSGVLKHPGKLGDKALEHLKESISRAHQGSGKSGGFLIIEEGMEWKEMSMTFEDAQFLELLKFNRAEIAAIFRVPPHKIGDLDRATFSNIEHQALEYVIDGLMARLVRWEQAISRDLILGADKKYYFAEFLVDALLRGDLVSRYNAYSVGINAGVINPDEARAMENMNSRPGGNRFWQPLNMSTVGAGQQERVNRVLRSASLRLANKELIALRKATAKYEGKEFIEWAQEFYRGYGESLSESLQLPRDVTERYTSEAMVELKAASCLADLITEWESRHAERLTELALAE